MLIDCQYLVHLARHKPTLFLDEYNQRLAEYRYLPASIATIHRTLARAGLSLKHVQKLASERKPLVRAGFIHRISQYSAHYLITLDEVSKDNRTYARIWGRASRGERVEKHNPFVRKERFSMLVPCYHCPCANNQPRTLFSVRTNVPSAFFFACTCPTISVKSSSPSSAISFVRVFGTE